MSALFTEAADGRLRLCRVVARWTPGRIPPASMQDVPPPRPVAEAEALTAAARDWRYPEPNIGLVGVDTETQAALLAAMDGTPLVLSADGLSWAGRFPILIDHERPPVGWFVHVQRDGDAFTAEGYAEPEHLAALLARPFMSPTFKIRRARLDAMYGLKLATVTHAEVVELSAVADPLFADTSLVTFAAAPLDDAERFAVEHADTMRLGAFATVSTVGGRRS